MTRSRSPRPTHLTAAALSVVLAAGAAAMAGCAGQGDIDRTQPDKLDKAIFFDAAGQSKVWYYQKTAVGVPPTTRWIFEGMQGGLEKVRFAITQTQLIGYRAYDYVPGSQNDFTGAGNNTDTPLFIYAITSHFDVKREYNPATGEETNVISENTTDRPWDKRQYMRVNFAINLAEPVDTIGGTPISDPVSDFANGKALSVDRWVSEVDASNPEFADRPIFTSGLMDFTVHEVRSPDLMTCATWWDAVFDDKGPWGCGQVEVRMRHSFKEVTPSTYEPLEYPDNIPLLDTQGKPIQLVAGGYSCSNSVIQSSGGAYSGADCTTASVAGFSKFGFFRTVRQSYDRRVGAVEAGRKYYANRWNIWQDSIQRDADGKPMLDASGQPKRLPYGQRKVKPIVYYTNIEFPDDQALFDEATAVANDWSEALKKTVAGLLATEPLPDKSVPMATLSTMADGMAPMVILKRNSCNLTDFKARLAQYPDLEDRVVAATGQSAGELDKAHLAQACSVVEAATQTLKDDDAKKFTWQRVGDLRYSFFHWVDRPQPGGPLGYGPSSADPETGEIISASLFNYGAALDSYAQQSADTVNLLNDTVSIDDILSGKTIVDVLRETATAHKARDAKQLTDEAKAVAGSMLHATTASGQPRLLQIPTSAATAKLQAIKGTDVEQRLMTPDILAAMLPELSSTGQAALTQAQIDRASPVNWMSPQARQKRREQFQKLAMNGCMYMADFADDAIAGLALKLKGQGLSGDALVKALRVLIFRGLADHEMGHTMGLRHNFAGSTDALNYQDDYWRVRGMPESQWDANQLSEYAYSTVMDYGSRFNSDVHGLGKYDAAAIRFGYGQLVDTMPAGANNGGIKLANQVFLSDYSKLPGFVNGANNMGDGGVARYGTVTKPLTQYYLDPNARPDFTVVDTERPYKFCSDEFVGSLDCKPWDFGANQREIISDTIDRYRNYYFFTAFKRGRVTWSLDAFQSRLLERYYSRYNEAFQFYYFYGDYMNSLKTSLGRQGYEVDLGDDLLKASVDSLNALGEVLQTPEPGMHCPTAVSPDVMVLASPSGPNACLSGQPFMNVQIPDGKPYYVNFSDDYYWRITRAGSLYEKLAALIALTSTDARFIRVDSFADSNVYSINYYRLFKEQVLNLLSGVIRNDPSRYGGYVNGGNYTATPIVDIDTYGKVTYPTPPYMQPGVRRIDTPVNKTIRYYALGLTLLNLNSTWDSTLDIANYMNVTVKGSKDDVTFDPGVTVHEFIHPQSGLVYRSPQLDARLGIGVEIVDELNQIVGKAGVPQTLPAKYGYYGDGTSLPDWQTAKTELTAAQASGDQARYAKALSAFQSVDYLVSYRVDVLDDLRIFKNAFSN